jgi:hypothetical protein
MKVFGKENESKELTLYIEYIILTGAKNKKEK